MTYLEWTSWVLFVDSQVFILALSFGVWLQAYQYRHRWVHRRRHTFAKVCSVMILSSVASFCLLIPAAAVVSFFTPESPCTVCNKTPYEIEQNKPLPYWYLKKAS